jgi:hypothetical protein
MLTGRGSSVFPSPSHPRLVALVLVVGPWALGCGAASVPVPRYAPQLPSALEPVAHEPPPPRIEELPPRPAGATVWVDGEWSWRRRRWAWSPGRWVSPPPGATYSPWATTRGADGALYFAPARWRDAKGNEIPPPKALANANVESGAVVDPEGDMERTTVTGEEEE